MTRQDGHGRAMTGTTDAPRLPPPAFPWAWALPPLLLLVGMTAWGVAVYPDLPDRIPAHIGSDGVDRLTDKTPLTAFVPVYTYAGLTLLVTALTVVVLRVRPLEELPPNEPTSPFLNRPRTRVAVRRLARALLFLCTCLGVTLATTCAMVWRPQGVPELPGWVMAAPLLPVLVGTAPLLVIAVQDSRSGREK